jgi:acyl-ACP thioesterase
VKPEFLRLPEQGRRFTQTRRVRLGDVNTGNRLRLDAVACYLQDVAGDDVDDAGLAGAWVVRRTALAITRFPRYGEEVAITTFCSGTGSRWAERRTIMLVDGEPVVDAVAIWVYVDQAGRPAPLEDRFFENYGEAAGSRRVSGRLRLPPPEDGLTPRRWPARATDFDVLGHMNNAAYWEVVEDELATAIPEHVPVFAELEHRAAIEPEDRVEVRSSVEDENFSLWLTVQDEVRAAALVSARPSTRRSPQ